MSDDERVEVGVGPARLAVGGKAVSRVGDALADLISPFSQGFGLVGDHIRIYREKSVGDTLRKAQEHAAERGESIKPVNPKNLVQILESASLEDEKEGLGDLWARLLLSADEHFDSELAQLTDRLKRIGRREAEFLRKVTVESHSFPVVAISDRFVRGNSEAAFNTISAVDLPPSNEELNYAIDSMNRFGFHYGRVLFINYAPSAADQQGIYSWSDHDAALILEREQLMRVVFATKRDTKGELAVCYCDVTPLGVRLIRRCYPELVKAAEAKKGPPKGKKRRTRKVSS